MLPKTHQNRWRCLKEAAGVRRSWKCQKLRSEVEPGKKREWEEYAFGFGGFFLGFAV